MTKKLMGDEYQKMKDAEAVVVQREYAQQQATLAEQQATLAKLAARSWHQRHAEAMRAMLFFVCMGLLILIVWVYGGFNVPPQVEKPVVATPVTSSPAQPKKTKPTKTHKAPVRPNVNYSASGPQIRKPADVPNDCPLNAAPGFECNGSEQVLIPQN
jgi:hypothetical protein